MEKINLKTANLPKTGRNVFAPSGADCRFTGYIDKTIRFIEDFRLADKELWKRFAEQFSLRTDSENTGWRGEYWGKMMRGASFVYAYTKDAELYDALTYAVERLLETEDGRGCISSYTPESEFRGWDLWCRKYVMLGLQYFVEICEDDELTGRCIKAMRDQCDYLISKIGLKSDGKLLITELSSNWRGLNSASVLEPVVRLYNLTGEKKYLDFAEYIVDTGATSIENIFTLAYENNFYPYQYPITKAYEMTSCFEGLLEFYRATGIERYRTALVNFANKVLESDFTVIGSSGCTHELFDFSTARQANTTNGRIMQETCVTVTLMKFFWQMTLLTGEPKFADAFERSLYNAYFGAVNTNRSVEPTISKIFPDAVVEPLPFDSYSPLTAGTRGNGIGGLQLMADKHYFGCCACIGSLGAGLIGKMALLANESTAALNLYIPGAINADVAGGKLSLDIETEYPADGCVKITVNEAPSGMTLLLRNPGWSRTTALCVNGELAAVNGGYISLKRAWKTGDTIELLFDMRTEAIRPLEYGHAIIMNRNCGAYDYATASYDIQDPKALANLALRRGPLTLAVDSRLSGSVDDAFDIAVAADGYVAAKLPESDKAPFEHVIELEIPTNDGKYFRVTDYSSAGKLWTEESRIAAWIRTK